MNIYNSDLLANIRLLIATEKSTATSEVQKCLGPALWLGRTEARPMLQVWPSVMPGIWIRHGF